MDKTADDEGTGLTAESVAEAVRTAAAGRSADETLRTVIQLAVRAAGCDGGSIVTRAAGQSLQTLASSDDQIRKADELQNELGEGPCVDVAWTDGEVVVDDLMRDRRFPRWGPSAAALGMRSLIAVHLFTDASLGALNLYATGPGRFDDPAVQNVRVVAAHASVILAHLSAERNMWRAIDSRNLIGQAQGILMARYDLTPEEAFSVLRRYSQDRNRRLVLLAEDVTRIGGLPDLADVDHHPRPGER